MRRTILVFGLISGGLVGLFLVAAILINFKGGAWFGYTTMIIALSLIYVGVRNFRDKFNDGMISFGKALKIAMGITLIASTIYVLVWLVEYYVFMPDFMDKYAVGLDKAARASKLSPEALQKELTHIESIRVAYHNPLMVVLFTYAEIVPVGIVISLITALLLKRKRHPSASPTAVA